ncbi:hypothetical protein [uncultured Bacteroides sp.]|nr:hypothetical protein [uncultured Bacteroides sp.]
MSKKWIKGYNNRYLHHPLGEMSPNKYRNKDEINNNIINLAV